MIHSGYRIQCERSRISGCKGSMKRFRVRRRNRVRHGECIPFEYSCSISPVNSSTCLRLPHYPDDDASRSPTPSDDISLYLQKTTLSKIRKTHTSYSTPDTPSRPHTLRLLPPPPIFSNLLRLPLSILRVHLTNLISTLPSPFPPQIGLTGSGKVPTGAVILGTPAPMPIDPPVVGVGG